jgi:hypothetical protein
MVAAKVRTLPLFSDGGERPNSMISGAFRRFWDVPGMAAAARRAGSVPPQWRAARCRRGLSVDHPSSPSSWNVWDGIDERPGRPQIEQRGQRPARFSSRPCDGTRSATATGEWASKSIHVHLGGPAETSVHTSWRPAFGGVAPTFATFGCQAQSCPLRPDPFRRNLGPPARQETAFYGAGTRNIFPFP